MGPGGVLRPLQPASVQRAARRLRRERVEAVAVCLLHAYADPRHEQAVAAALRAALPGVHVVASHEVAAEFREFERASTTIADAYLGPVAGRYLRRLAGTAAAEGLPPPAVMQSNGGVCDLAEAAAHPARLLLSGPAGGVAAVVAAGDPDAISFDMGGTSTDVCLIRAGRAGRSAERRVGGPASAAAAARHPHGRAPAGAASRGSMRAARCASARQAQAPIPARPATAAAASVPTVTDANLVLGRLDADVPLAGGLRLDVEAARARARDGGRAVRRRPRRCRGRDRGRKRRDGAGDRGRQRRAGPRPARARAGRVRRGGAAARLRGGRQPRHARGGRARGRRRALGARDRRRRAAPGRGRERDAAPGRVPRRRARRGACAARRHGRDRGRAALPRPGARADRAAAAAGEHRPSLPRPPPRALRVRRAGGRDRGGERAHVDDPARRRVCARDGSPPRPAVRGPASVPLDGATLWVARGVDGAPRGRDGAWRLAR